MDLFICSKCGANLIEFGIVEVTSGGHGKTGFSFHDKKSTAGTTDITDFDDQWVECKFCGAELRDRTAIEIIEAYEGDLPHIRRECDVCGETFAEVECGECEYRAGQCTGIREDKDLCQKCCAEEFAETLSRNPLSALLAESA
jgi:hypothetical protein